MPIGRPAYWEGDLHSGADNTYLATLVERHTRVAMPSKVPRKNTVNVLCALAELSG